MTLDKHLIDGISPITTKVMPTPDFDALLIQAGYRKIGTAPAQGNRIKAWWSHSDYARVEVIYSADGAIAKFPSMINPSPLQSHRHNRH